MIRGVLSGKGGVGKTTITVNLGLAMHKLGENVVVLDGDIKNPNLGLQLGVFNYNITLQEAIEKQISLLEALYIHETGLRFIPAHISLKFLETDASKLRSSLKDIPYDLLIDSPPGLNKESLAILECCDEILIVSEPFIPDITDCMKTIEIARELGVKINGIILNKVRDKDYELKKEEIEGITNTKIISTIPFEEDILKSLSLKNPIVNYYPLSKASVCIFQLASLLSGRKYKIPRFIELRRLFSIQDIQSKFMKLFYPI